MLKLKVYSRLTSHVSLILFAIFAWAIPGHAAPGDISTVAGNGTAGYSGESGQATSASLNYPSSVAVDSSGNIYIADTDNSSIRKVEKLSGNITTVAGNGTAGFSGDGGDATLASLKYPYGVAVDSTGNIYIADSQNNRIRKVESGASTTYNCTSTNATVSYCEVTNIPAGQSGNFTPQQAVSIGLTDVNGSANNGPLQIPPLSVPFADITLSGTITGNGFTGAVTTPSIIGATTTTVTGNFYGVTANEVSGAFTISVPSPGPGMILIGSFGAKQ